VNITEWKIDPNVWCLDCVHFPVIFCFHEQVDGTVNFPSFNWFSSLEALIPPDKDPVSLLRDV
jgi:hypothetical protein